MLALSNSIESDASIQINADETFEGIEEQDMLNLILTIPWKDFMSIANQISEDGMTVITSSGKDFTSRANGNRVAAFFMLFHDIAARTFGVLRSVFIVNINLSSHRNRDHSPQVCIPLITQVAAVG